MGGARSKIKEARRVNADGFRMRREILTASAVVSIAVLQSARALRSVLSIESMTVVTSLCASRLRFRIRANSFTEA